MDKVKLLNFKRRAFVIIFGTDTPAGRLYDIILIYTIIFSIVVVILESFKFFDSSSNIFNILEFVITIIFTIEYALRVYCSPHPWRYIKSFYGIIDLISTLPFYLGLFLPGTRYLIIIRTFRLVRIFKVFKLFSFLNEGDLLLTSIVKSVRKIVVFFLFMLVMVISIGTIMYMIEGGEPNTQFTNIPNSIYWAIVTMTTVGYGDIAPITLIGRVISGIVMLMGYTIIAVPTGIVTASIVKSNTHKRSRRRLVCPRCGNSDNDRDANYCKVCGERFGK